MKQLLNAVIVTAAPVFVLVACQSKFSDQKPMASSSEFTVEGRMKANEELDKKLAKIETSADKVRKLIRQFRRVQSAKMDQDVYTHLDFMLDLNQEFRKSPIQQKDRKWVKYGKLKLNMQGLSAECAIVDTKVETTSLLLDQGEGEKDPAQIADGLVYFIKTCRSQDYAEILTVTFNGRKTTIGFNNQNLRQALEDTVLPPLKESTKCNIDTDQSEILSRVACSNLSAKLSATESLLIDTLNYDRFEAIRFLLEGRFMKGDLQKGTLYFAINKDGKPDIKIEKTP